MSSDKKNNNNDKKEDMGPPQGWGPHVSTPVGFFISHTHTHTHTQLTHRLYT